MNDYDIQSFLRISEEQPDLMGLKQHELIVSPDLISWKMYDKPGWFDYDAGIFMIDSFASSNLNLPTLGIELKYGLDEINYQSFWSERLTAYALWKSIKLGLILPTSGWSNLASDMFDQNRNLTHAGIGVAGEFDFPVKVIPKSGLFHFSFGYVFGDAAQSKYKNVNLSPDAYTTIDEYKILFNNDLKRYNNYLVRYNAQLLYTFAVAVDDDYMLRFGVGGTVYNVEQWYNDLVENEVTGDRDFNHKMFKSETIGGLTGKVELMVTNVTTPYGASLQYFDEGLSGGIWLQIPIVKNLVALRFDAKGFSPVFRDENHQWEVGGIFTPMARVIVNF
jgi:hypothetical protein